MSKFQVAIVSLLDGRKFYARDWPTLHRALSRIGENRKEEVAFVEMTEREYHEIGTSTWAAEFSAP